jgi:mRNA interferase RelE/StbE
VAAIYSIEIRPRARRSLRQLDTPARKAIATAIDSLAIEPRPVDVTAIKGHRPWLRTRVGDYRIIYAVDDHARSITVAAIGPRREVYRDLNL